MKKSLQIRLFRIFFVAIALFPVEIALRATSQELPANLSYEAASIKPVDPSHKFTGAHYGPHINAASASYWDMTPANLISYAYKIEWFQIEAPEWAKSERFNIESRFPDGVNKEDNSRMLQSLLKDRFKLSGHIEKEELDGYALIVGKHGSKLRPSPPGPVNPEIGTFRKDSENDAAEIKKPKSIQNADGSITSSLGAQGTQTLKFNQETQAIHWERSKMTMEELAHILTACLGGDPRKVVDATGIKGNYQVAWECPPPVHRQSNDDSADDLLPAPPFNSSLAGSLDAMGLKLEKRKVLQDVYVVDHIERPLPN